MRRLASQLPLAITLVVLVVVSVFSWLAYREVRTAALSGAGERLEDIAGLLVERLESSAVTVKSTIQEYAADTTLVDAITGEGPVTEPLRERLEALRSSSAQIDVVEVWTAEGTSVVRLGEGDDAPSSSEATTFPRWLAGDEPAISGFATDGEQAWYDVAAPVRDESGAVGYVVQRMALTATPQGVRTLSALVGMEASVLAGAPGALWTNFSTIVDGPPDVPYGEPIEYEDDSGTWRVGTGSAIPGTPWVVWVSSPRSVILARATGFLERMVPIAAIMVLVGGLVSWLLIRSLTAPLKRLTGASTALAEGSYERVPVAGPQELSQLAAAFNRMADGVEAAQLELERRVDERTAELEAFAYSVSHDLRAPLRAVHGYCHALEEEVGDGLGAEGTHYVSRISAGVQRMGLLIDDLLELSRVTRTEMTAGTVNLDSIAAEIVEELRHEQPARRVEFRVASGLRVAGDSRLLRLLMQNLLENAWKFTSRKQEAVIEVGAVEGELGTFYVRDNGAGFDMAYADKLFGVFERLHRPADFPGTGVGLAIVERIVRRHGGRVWADGEEGAGATFYVSLPAA